MKWIEKIKKKLQRKSIILEVFEEGAEITNRILENLVFVLDAFCEHDREKIQKYCATAMELENELHNIYHTSVEKMFSRKIMNFSREERHLIMSKLLDLGDLSNFIIRRIKAHHPYIDPEITQYLQKGIPFIKKSGNELKKLVINLFQNFDKAQDNIWKIHHIQRELWSLEVDFFKNIYQNDLNPENILYLEILERNLRNIVMIMVRFSDKARTLILKYTL